MTQKASVFSPLGTVLRCIPCALTALGFLLMAIFLAPNASAHDVLVSSSPEDGEEIEELSEFALTFNNDPIDMNAAIVITGPDGDDTEIETDPIVEGRDVYTELPQMDSGEYDVTWRVVSSDGHPISGEQSFTITGDNANGDEKDDDEAQADTGEETTKDDDSASSSEAEESGEANATDDSNDSGDSEGLPTAVWIAILVALIAGVVAAFSGKKKKTPQSTPETDETSDTDTANQPPKDQ